MFWESFLKYPAAMPVTTPGWLGAASRSRMAVLAVLAAVGLLMVGVVERLARRPRVDGGRRRVQVVAAENFWGSIASAAGREPTPTWSASSPTPTPIPTTTSRPRPTVAPWPRRRMVIENGVGYDPWAPKLVAADQVDGQQVLDVGHLLGLAAARQPPSLVLPGDVERVVDRITADYQRLDPADAAYFARQRQQFETVGLARYHQVLAQIRSAYAGHPGGRVGEHLRRAGPGHRAAIWSPRRATCGRSARAPIPTAADRSTVDAQIGGRRIRVWVFNSQNATPDIQTLTRRGARPERPPGDHHHRDAVAGQPLVPGLAGSTSSESLAGALAPGTDR